jgi:RNA polymerase sigma factor (sigma-70 family)
MTEPGIRREAFPVPDLRVGRLQELGLGTPAGNAAFEAIHGTYTPGLTQFCGRRLTAGIEVDHPGVVEEVVQDTWMSATGALNQFEPERPVWPWLSTIAARGCVDRIRASGARPHSAKVDIFDMETLGFLDPEQRTSTNPKDRTAVSIQLLEFLDMIEPLSRERRELLMRQGLGETNPDLAKLHDVPVGTVKGWYRAAHREADKLLAATEAI